MGSPHNDPMIDLWLVRHGETDFNRALRFQGHLDAPLNALGMRQAQRLGEHLAAQDVRPLLVSDLLRTRQTAEPVATQWQTLAVTDPLWREQSFGVIEGLTLDEVRERHPDVVQGWRRLDPDFAPEGGESRRQFHARVMQAVQALVARCAQEGWSTGVVVSHGGVLDMVYRSATGQSLAGPRECLIPNAGLNLVRTDGVHFEIVHWAQTGHLEGLPPSAVYPVATPSRA
jgi:2,3-bisphosphoglycerate-dependent phosphoglycerate mutase